MEPKSIAKQFGVAGCGVSVPLSQSDVVEDARRFGNPNLDSYPEWIEINHRFDQEINCASFPVRRMAPSPRGWGRASYATSYDVEHRTDANWTQVYAGGATSTTINEPNSGNW